MQTCAFQPDLEPLVDVFIEVIEQHLPGLAHAGLDLLVEFLPELFEGDFDFLRGAALLIDFQHAALEVDGAIDKAEDVV